MSVPRAHDGSCDLTVQPTVSALHIPATHAFIPFQQFSLTDTSGLRNPADDNNNKTAVPVVSVVTAVSGLCPAIPVVSMQQQAQLGQAVVAPTIIPTVVAPMTVQTANGITPTTTMTMTNTLNISSHLSVPTPQQQQQQQVLGSTGINLSLSNNVMNNNNTNGTPAATSSLSNKPVSSGNNKPTNNNGNSNSSNSSNNSCNSPPAKTSNSSVNSKTSPSSSSQNSDQTTDDLVKPVFKDGELVLEVECGQNKAILYLSKLCQGSKGPCISFQSSWLTPNEFQFVSGRETAKDWKRSIRHHGKSLKLLLAKGILNVHPTMCDCDGCRQGATLTRKGEKRRIPNGERKPRKPNSNTSSGGNEAHVPGAFRPVGNSAMTAHLASPGGSQTKPDAKRPASDKHKMGDTLPPSQLKEALTSVSKQNLPVKSTPSQRPDTLKTSGDDTDKKSSKTSASCGTSSAPTSPLEPKAPGNVVLSIPSSTLQSNSSSAPTTPVRIQPIGTGPAMPPSLSAQTNQLINSFAGASQLNQILPPSASSSTVTTNSQSLTEPEPNSINNKLTRTPSLPNGEQAKDSSATGEIEATSVNVSDKPSAELEEGGYVNSEMDDAENSEMNGNEDSEEEDDLSDDAGRESDDNDTSNTHDALVVGTKQDSLPKDSSGNNEGSQALAKDVDTVKTSNKANTLPESAEPSEVPVSSEDLSTSSGVPAATESSPISSFSVSPSAPKTSATLAVSAVSGSCSQPLTVSVSTTNVKSEHIWVPPTLSPTDDKQHIHKALKGSSSNNNSSMKSPSQKTQQPENTHLNVSDLSMTSSSNKTEEKHHSPKSLNTVEHSKRLSSTFNSEHGTVQQENAPVHKNPYSIERHLSHHTDKELAMRVKHEHSPKGSYPSGSSSSDKSSKDREREERLKQKIREERNRKDREREERREKERREEKDIERRRHEEKERLARVQAENASKQERSSVTPVAAPMDPSRRLPGGVADAAAFSDYMRVLAAGHGHTFMPSTPTYLPSLFPIRPPDTPLPSPLFNPYAPQVSGIPKDPILFPTSAGTLPGYPGSPLGPYHPLMQRAQYPAQPSLLEYQRSLAAASYPWAAAYPYLMPEMAAAASSSSAASAAAAAVKRHSSEMEVAMELNAKRMRLEGRPPEYSSPLDYFAAAASQQQQRAQLPPSLPCGLESANVDKTAEFLRKRYMEYGPQAAAYLSALPEYARPMYHCACADHRDEDIRMWNVEDVCKFLNSLDGCSIYSDHFREQRVDGRILALLTTDHLVKTLGMKLGPAILLSDAVAKKLQDISKMSNCEACRSIAMSQPIPPMAIPM